MTQSDKQPSHLLSITVLNYNYARYLGQCLDTIVRQTWRDFELIVINDCSTDNSFDVIRPYLADPRVRLVNHEANQGYVSSLVEGCALSTGRYITVISADDYVLDDQAFEASRGILEADAGIVFCYSAWNEIDDQGHIRHTRRAAAADYVADGVDEFRRLLLSSPILHSGTVIRRDAYNAVGGYDTRCRYSVDTNMWLSLCAQGKVAYVDRPLYAYRSHATNMSNTEQSLWQPTTEMLLGIDTALSLFSDHALPDKAALRRRARRRALVAVPTLDIFSGRSGRGWLGYWQACRHYPLLTVLQPRTLALGLRTLLGARLYSYMRCMLRGKRSRINTRQRTIDYHA